MTKKFAPFGSLSDFAVILLYPSWNISLPEPGGPYAPSPRSRTRADRPPSHLRLATSRHARTYLLGGLPRSKRAAVWRWHRQWLGRAVGRPRAAPARGRSSPRAQTAGAGPRTRTRPGASEPRALLGASSPRAAPAPPSSLTRYWRFSPGCGDQKTQMGPPRGGMLREGPEVGRSALATG